MTYFTIEPLSTILQQAGLVSEAQLKSALSNFDSKNRLSEDLLVRCGLVTQQTVDFFAQKWSNLLHQQRQPLGQYFKEAGLLNSKQLQAILEEQQQTGQPLGEIAVTKGWLKQNTVEFFVKHLYERPLKRSEKDRYDDGAIESMRDRLLSKTQCRPYWLLSLYAQILQQGAIKADNSFEQNELVKVGLAVKERGQLVPSPIYKGIFNQSWLKKELNRLQPYETTIASRSEVGSWERLTAEVQLRTNGQKHLTQNLCQLLGEYQTLIPAGEEAKWVDEVIRTHIVRNWQQGVVSKHLRQIADLLMSDEGKLLNLYEQILKQEAESGGAMPSASWGNCRLKYQKLLELELAAVRHNQLVVHNSIYEKVFDLAWVEQAKARRQASSAEDIANQDEAEPTITLAISPPELVAMLERVATRRRPSKLSIWGGLVALGGLASFIVVSGAKMLQAPLIAPTQATNIPEVCSEYSRSRQKQIEKLQALQQQGTLVNRCQQLKDELVFGHAIETLASNNYRQEAVGMLCEVTVSFYEGKQNLVPYFRNWSASSPSFKSWLERYLQNHSCPAAHYLMVADS